MTKPHIAIRATGALAMLALGMTLSINKGSWFPMLLCGGLAIRTLIRG